MFFTGLANHMLFSLFDPVTWCLTNMDSTFEGNALFGDSGRRTLVTRRGLVGLGPKGRSSHGRSFGLKGMKGFLLA